MKFHILIVGRFPISKAAIASAINQRQCSKVWIVEDDAGFEGQVNARGAVMWHRGKRNYAAHNIYQALHNFIVAAPEDVICMLDGDDSLIPGALDYVKVIYQHIPNTLITHGSYRKASKAKGGFNGPYDPQDVFRKAPWRASHLKTFRYGLACKVPVEAFQRSGEWLKTCSDLALMFPMLEMAGHKRIQFVKERIYVYNDLNPENDHKVAGKEQAETDRYLRGLKPFERVEI
jgi:hypothetical protein